MWPRHRYERDVDVVSLRAADFATGEGPWGGFVEYARIQPADCRSSRADEPGARRDADGRLIPAWAHAAVVRANPASLDDIFGTLCVTIVRQARVFIAPMTDLGLSHGFFAIGSARLPSGTGTPVTSVSVRGRPDGSRTTRRSFSGSSKGPPQHESWRSELRRCRPRLQCT